MLLHAGCATCGCPGRSLCAGCFEQILAPHPAEPPAGCDVVRTLMSYEGRGRDLVIGLKYRNGRGTARLIGAAMAELVAATDVDLVTWAPTSFERRATRGYDQSRLLARSVAGCLGRPHRRILRRAPGPAQTGRTRPERERGPRFVARPVPDQRVLVIDDVVTTGATLRAAARALRTAGAAEVWALTAASTPLKPVD